MWVSNYMWVGEWCKYEMEIWQNLEKKRNTDHDFPFMWAKNKNLKGRANSVQLLGFSGTGE